MWNWLISGLATGAACMLYDGSPFANGGRILWDFAEAERFTLFGTSAKYIDAIKKAGVVPRRRTSCALRAVLSTGSPLLPESFDYVYECVKPDVHLASISGGTDIMACLLPAIRRCRSIAASCNAAGSEWRPTSSTTKVIRSRARWANWLFQTFPSMPLYFMNDPDGARYRASYFERFPGLWCHGDWCQITANDGMVIVGRRTPR